MPKIVTKIIKIIALGIFFLILSGVAFLVYAVKIEPYMLRTDTLNIKTEFSEELNIVQISDIQISENFTVENLEKIVAAVNKETPDIVLFTGDLFEVYAKYHDNTELIKALSKIEASYGKYAIWGNRDYGGGAVRKYEDIMLQSGFQFLRNEAVSIVLNDGEKLFLAGLDDALLGNPNIDPIMESFQPEDSRFSILLTHEPDTADLYTEMGFDLIVSGHSHGGQVKIPFLPPMTTAMAEKYIDGLYQLNTQTSLYVNSGIGTSRYPIRFGVVPEITVFHMENEE